MKHKHCEVIKAWADGAEIERYSSYNNKWMDCCTPIWLDDVEYRVKPKKKQKWVRPYIGSDPKSPCFQFREHNDFHELNLAYGYEWAGDPVLVWEEK